MKKKFKISKIPGQSTAEFVALFTLIVAAAVAMQIYVRRALQAKQKDSVVYVMRNVLGMSGKDKWQYEPYYQTSNIHSHQYQNESTKIYNGLRSEYSSYQNVTYRKGSNEVQEGWTNNVAKSWDEIL